MNDDLAGPSSGTAAFVDGPVVGLDCVGPRGASRSTAGGALAARPGERIQLAIGDLRFGHATATESLSSVDLDPTSTSTRFGHRALNVARLLHSLGADPDLNDGITLTDAHRSIATRFEGSIDFDAPTEEFAADPAVRALLDAWGVELRSEVAARNHLRRTRYGIKKLSSLRVPTRDGSYLLADVFRPLDAGPVPAVVRLSVYGRAFGFGSICDDEARQRSEDREHAWFVDRSSAEGFAAYAENLTSVDAFVWVPRGYAVVRVDSRGIGESPGPLRVFSAQEAIDYYDAIEWVAAQPWCDGAVGLAGTSYAATLQWNVARLQPPSLRAMIPWAGDVDSYRDLTYPGGIFLDEYRDWWWRRLVRPALCPGTTMPDLVGWLREHPTDDPAFYGPDGEGPVTAALDEIRIPFLTAVSQIGTVHARGGIQAFRESPVHDKRLFVVDSHYFPFFYDYCLEDLFAFFDRWLKGVTAAEEPPPVRYVTRIGNGEFEWHDSTTWPPSEAQHLELHLDASTAMVDGGRPVGTAGWESPPRSAAMAYAADDRDPATSGISFLSPPLSTDTAVVGDVMARLTLSSSSSDADVFVSIRAVAPDGRETPFHIGGSRNAPLTWGCLKASHRALDATRSTLERPWHSHRAVDVTPLRPGEPTELLVELLPMAVRIPAGHRLRVDVQPVEGPGGFFDDPKRPSRAYDEEYHANATNRVHTGAGRDSFVRLSVLPE